jgi:hypothetical protein
VAADKAPEESPVQHMAERPKKLTFSQTRIDQHSVARHPNSLSRDQCMRTAHLASHKCKCLPRQILATWRVMDDVGEVAVEAVVE